jgi:hypothetical protein
MVGFTGFGSGVGRCLSGATILTDYLADEALAAIQNNPNQHFFVVDAAGEFFVLAANGFKLR